MRFLAGDLVASPTDLANFLVCRFKTTLDLAAACGRLPKLERPDSIAEALRQRGERHEKAFIDTLRRAGLSVKVRKRKGSEIDAACGQLRRKVEQEAAAV